MFINSSASVRGLSPLNIVSANLDLAKRALSLVVARLKNQPLCTHLIAITDCVPRFNSLMSKG